MSIAKMFEAGRMAAREDQERSALAKHLQPALGGDKAAQQAIYGVAPMRGMEVEGLAQKRQEGASEAARKQLADLSTLATRAPHMAAQVYPQWRAALEATGLASGLPEQYEEGAMQAMQAFATQADDGIPSAIRELQMLQSNPELRKLDMERRQAGWRPQVLTTDQGFAAYDPRSGGVSPLNYGQPQGDAPATLDPVQDFGQLGRIPGVKTTSLFRDPERNARVGGVANSFHTKGQAGDFVVPPQEKAAFIQQARAMGYEALDEGDHVHVEPRPGARAASAFGPERVKPPGKAGDKPSDLERRVQMARDMGATDEDVRRMVVGGDSGRDAQRISAGDATKARQKMTQIRSARQQLNAVKAAFQKLRGTYSAGIGGSYLPTPEGQAFDRAIRNLSPLITAVTRVPGVGAMSDFESKLQEASLPSRGTYEDVTVQQIGDLERLLDTIEGGYTDLLGGSQPAAPQRAADAPAPKRLKFNPATGRIE